MVGTPRDPDRVATSVVRRAVALGAAVALLTSCGGAAGEREDARPTQPPGSSTGAPAPAAPTSATPAPPVSATPVPSPVASIPTDPTELARRLDEALAVVRDPQAADENVRQAAELQQLAVRALALGSASFRRQVTGALHPSAARQARSDVRALQLLTVITAPKPKFPPWQVIAPPPVPVLLRFYREAQRSTGVPWTYLAAIHLVETRMGRIRGPSTAGALGPMQFLPTTWARYGAGGDINDPHDAIEAAGRLLAAHGAPGDMAGALWHYNPSARYVGAVTAYATTLERTPATYRGYWHWRVLYRHVRGTYVLPDGYPAVRPVRVGD